MVELKKARSMTKRLAPPVNERAPQLTKKEYYTVPPLKKLKRMTDEALQVRVKAALFPAVSSYKTISPFFITFGTFSTTFTYCDSCMSKLLVKG